MTTPGYWENNIAYTKAMESAGEIFKPFRNELLNKPETTINMWLKKYICEIDKIIAEYFS